MSDDGNKPSSFDGQIDILEGRGRLLIRPAELSVGDAGSRGGGLTNKEVEQELEKNKKGEERKRSWFNEAGNVRTVVLYSSWGVNNTLSSLIYRRARFHQQHEHVLVSAKECVCTSGKARKSETRFTDTDASTRVL